MRLSYAVADRPSPLYRNAIGDECMYVESGAARFESVFGAFDIAAGDYVLVPTSCTYRLVPAGGETLGLNRRQVLAGDHETHVVVLGAQPVGDRKQGENVAKRPDRGDHDSRQLSSVEC